MNPISQRFQLIRNMGLRYAVFRITFELKKKLGILSNRFPQNPQLKKFITLNEWQEQCFFWGVSKHETKSFEFKVLPNAERILRGEICFFSAKWINLGGTYDWVTNPDSGYRYDPQEHWSKVKDYSLDAGDIKFVWEKSRFSYLYEIMRYDFVFGSDHSKFIFDEIRSWLKVNKVNSGPNYKCSQEISLRILNWTYALNFYKSSVYLTEELFDQVINSIYWQLKHVHDNISFSRIAVRNNHAITETLTLYLGGSFYPFFPESEEWKSKGKKWFEQEIAYQIYSDGTFLQFSMNYHRVVVQLLTWAVKSADFFGDRFSDVIYDRAYKSVRFLLSCQDETTGRLPNYGSNDGALFFKFNSCDYRDYRPQLNTLHKLLTGSALYETGIWDEDAFWFKAKKASQANFSPLKYETGWISFQVGGYFVLRESDVLTFIRCGNHKDRPAQADNLHMDVWYKGENVLFDAGSYKYNTDADILKYFMGTASHNTVVLDDSDQMLKGPRFIWYNWSQAICAEVGENYDTYLFDGTISAFKELGRNIKHNRKVVKVKNERRWIIKDQIINKPEGISMKQYWHILPDVYIDSKDALDARLVTQLYEGMRSDYYGIKERAMQIIVESRGDTIISTITLI